MANIQSPTSILPVKKFKAEKVAAGSREYNFTIKTGRAGKQYLAVTQVRADGSSEASPTLVVFQRHLVAFHKGLVQCAKQLERKLKAYDVEETYDVEEIRQDYPNAFRKWMPVDDERLTASFKQGVEIIELAKLFGRQPGGIKSRLWMLGLISSRR